MKTFIWHLCLGGLMFAAASGSTTAIAAVPSAELTPLSIDFNDKTPGQSLGTGGVAFGEPVNLDSLDTLIVESSPGQNSLQVTNDLTSNFARSLRWEFEHEAEIAEGLVSVSFEFTPSVRDAYAFGVRERGGGARNFLSLDFAANGRLYANDAAGLIGEYVNFYNGGDTIHIDILFDMDARTSSLAINGNTLYSSRAHGISDRGVGRILTGYAFESNGFAFALDSLLVLANVPLPLVLDTDFNSQPPGQPIGIGGASLGEPVYVSPAITQQAILVGINNAALRLWDSAQGSSRFARWEFLDDREIHTGIVDFHMDLRLQPSQLYEINVKGPANASTLFAGIRFSANRRFGSTGRDGTVEIVSSRGTALLVGTYRSNDFQHLQLIFDMDAGTFSVKLDGNVLASDWAFDTRSGSGIASLETGFQKWGKDGTQMDIDNLQVGASEP